VIILLLAIIGNVIAIVFSLRIRETLEEAKNKIAYTFDCTSEAVLIISLDKGIVISH